MMLQLAENTPTVDPIIDQNYTYVPGVDGSPGVWVRDDEFDDLPEREWSALMDYLAPYQPGGDQMSEGSTQLALFGFGKKAKARRAEKHKAKIARKDAKTQMLLAKAQGIKQGTFQPGSAIGGVFSKITDVASSIFGGGGSGQEAEMPGGGMPPSPTERKPIYTNPIFLVGGAVAVGAIIYFATKKKK